MKQILLPLLSVALLLTAAGCQNGNEDETPQPAACTLAPEPGVCNAAFVRYYFDPKEKKCKPFTWGGCGGVVPFTTLQECQDCGCK